MDIGQIFRNVMGSGSSNPPANPTPAAPANSAQMNPNNPQNPANPNPTVPSSNTVIPNANDPGTPNAFLAGKTPGESPDKSPLANFAKLWDTDPNAPKQPELTGPQFQVDPAKIAEAAKSLDFAKLINPEVMTKALGGDQAAFSGILNAVTQAAYAQSAMATTKIVEAALAQQADQFKKILPNEMRKHIVNMELRNDNPLFSNPAVSPMLKVLENQLTAQYPQASAQDIAKVARDYMTEFASAITAGNKTPETPGTATTKLTGAKNDDWSAYFGVPSQ